MKIKAMLHTLRAVVSASNYRQFLVIGSQAVLLHCHDKNYEYAFDESDEVDIAPIPQNQFLSDFIDGTFGECSLFHRLHGYYAHGIGMETAIFPDGWEKRTSKYFLPLDEDHATIHYPSPEDILISKAVVGRDKDIRYIKKLVSEGLVDWDKISVLLEKLPTSLHEKHKKIIQQRVEHAFFGERSDSNEETSNAPSLS